MASPRAIPVPRLLDDSTAPDGRPARFGVVGSGWRAGFFLRMARLMPERFAVTGVVTRTAERGDQVIAEWDVATVRTVRELLTAGRPDFVVVAVPWAAAPEVTAEIVRAGVPVLTETPPAPDLPGLRALWDEVGASGLVQVAEHSPFLPQHVARGEVLRSGAIGEVTSVQMSSTHLHHAMGLIRWLLGTGCAPATVTARRFDAPLVDPRGRGGWKDDVEPKQAGTTLATLDLGPGRSALYDFTDNQWQNPLRANRLVVRGSHGELVDDRVTRLLDARTVVTSALTRRQLGIEQDFEGLDLNNISYDGRVVYRNAFVGARLADDDIAVAALLDAMAGWVLADGAPPYPLAEGSQDRLLAMAVEEAVRTGEPVSTEREVWADATG